MLDYQQIRRERRTEATWIEYWTAVRALIYKILNIRRRRAYTHIVSLGDNCRPSYQIKRHFKSSKSYPFDGWITPLDSAALYIEKLDEDLYDPASLQERAVNGEITTIVNTKFQIRLFHDFKRGGALENVLPDWKSGIENARSRTEHLVRKLQSLNRGSNNVLFVRLSDGVCNRPLLGTRLTQPQATERLLQALRRRFNRVSFDLLCVDFKHRLPEPDPSVIHLDMYDSAVGWQGTDSLWSQAFNQIDARLKPPRAR
jgi:hypothetical protein